MENPVQKAARLAGGQTALGKALNVSPQAVQQWVARGLVPADKCPAVEKLVNGEVRAEELNDKVDWAYIRASGSIPSEESTTLRQRRKTDRIKRRATDPQP